MKKRDIAKKETRKRKRKTQTKPNAERQTPVTKHTRSQKLQRSQTMSQRETTGCPGTPRVTTGGQLPRTGIGPVLQTQSSTSAARPPKATLVWGTKSIYISIYLYTSLFIYVCIFHIYSYWFVPLVLLEDQHSRLRADPATNSWCGASTTNWTTPVLSHYRRSIVAASSLHCRIIVALPPLRRRIAAAVLQRFTTSVHGFALVFSTRRLPSTSSAWACLFARAPTKQPKERKHVPALNLLAPELRVSGSGYQPKPYYSNS